MFIYSKGQLLINHYWKQNSKNRSTAFLEMGSKYLNHKKQNTECLYDYKELVRNIFAAEGIKGNVSVYLEGRIRGALNYEERSYLADRMIKKLDGKIVTESRDNDIFTIYAYTSNIEGYIKSVGRKIKGTTIRRFTF